MKRTGQSLALALFFFVLSGPTQAEQCDDACGWNGLYATGGLGSYGLGLDLSGLSQLLQSGNSWGGSCGSLYSTCSSPYDSVSYGGSTNPGDITLDINTYLVPGLSPFDTCYTGFCGNTLPPPIITPFPSPGYPIVTLPRDPTTPPPGFFPPVLPPPPFIPPPPTPVPPPWGGCDNIVVPCPPGPFVRTDLLTQPRVINGIPRTVGVDPSSSPFVNPFASPLVSPGLFPTVTPVPHFDPTQQLIPVPSNRYRIPRGS